MLEQYDTFIIQEITTVFDEVSRITAVNKNRGQILCIDLHNNFFNFFNSKESYIGSEFKYLLSIQEPSSEFINEISYMMIGYKISKDIVSCHGLLIKDELVSKIIDKDSLVYCTIIV